MKKSLALLAVLGCFSQSSMAATFNMANLAGIGQPAFRTLSEDFGAALSYKPITPAAALGITGFDVGIEVSATDISKSAATWKQATGSSNIPSTLPIPKLHVAKGLPFGIDVAAFYTAIPQTNISSYGAELRYAIIDGGIAMPAVAVRGAMTKLNGIDEFSFGTKSLDISVSKGFVGFTPYAGAGMVWVDSSTSNAVLQAAGIQAESFTQSKVFIGANLNMGLPNLAIEADQTGGISTYSVKLGLRW